MTNILIATVRIRIIERVQFRLRLQQGQSTAAFHHRRRELRVANSALARRFFLGCFRFYSHEALLVVARFYVERISRHALASV